jgi:elongation factor Ts
MSEVTTALIKQLREQTGAGIMDCKRVLVEKKGNLEKAVELLREKGLAKARKRADKVTPEGLISSYIHTGGKLGVLVEVNCETDFVARTGQFKEFVKDIAMQVTASEPLYISKEEVPPKVIKKEKNEEEYFAKVCLLEQPFIKDPNIKVKEYLTSKITQLGENAVIRRFIRYKVGEEI